MEYRERTVNTVIGGSNSHDDLEARRRIRGAAKAIRRPARPLSGLQSAEQRPVQSFYRTKKDLLVRIPRQQAQDEPAAVLHKLRRHPDEGVHELLELHAEEFLRLAAVAALRAGDFPAAVRAARRVRE